LLLQRIKRGSQAGACSTKQRRIQTKKDRKQELAPTKDKEGIASRSLLLHKTKKNRNKERIASGSLLLQKAKAKTGSKLELAPTQDKERMGRRFLGGNVSSGCPWERKFEVRTGLLINFLD